MVDARYQAPVAGLSPDELAAKLRASIAAVQGQFPYGTGVVVFTFDMAGAKGNGLGYIANAERADVIKALEEWIRHQRRLS
jgi:hypothetical protein